MGEAEEFDDLRAAARERGGALLMRGEGEGMGEPLFLVFRRESEGIVSAHLFAGDEPILELVGMEKDIRLALDEPYDE